MSTKKLNITVFECFILGAIWRITACLRFASLTQIPTSVETSQTRKPLYAIGRKKRDGDKKMEESERMFQLDEWILSPHVKVVVGDDTSVIYDFGKTKTYQVSKFVGVLLNTVFNNKDVSKPMPRWRKELEGRP
jgi:hypothetical protein